MPVMESGYFGGMEGREAFGGGGGAAGDCPGNATGVGVARARGKGGEWLHG